MIYQTGVAEVPEKIKFVLQMLRTKTGWLDHLLKKSGANQNEF